MNKMKIKFTKEENDVRVAATAAAAREGKMKMNMEKREKPKYNTENNIILDKDQVIPFTTFIHNMCIISFYTYIYLFSPLLPNYSL